MKTIRVLSIVSKAYPLIGGAQINNFTLLKGLSKRFFYDCYMYTSYPLKRKVTLEGVKVNTFRDLEELKAMIKKLRPDIIVSALDAIHHGVRMASHFNIPNIAYLDSFEYCPPSVQERKRWKVSLQREYPTKEDRDFVFREADTIVANSYYLKDRVKRNYGISPRVIYPEFDKKQFLLKDRNLSMMKYVTGVCGYTHKGAEIFLKLSRMFKGENFQLVGDIDYRYVKEFKKQKNIELVPFTQIKKALQKSKIILAPSQWTEPFGRIAIEAMANGIPLLASFTGGMREIIKNSSLGIRSYHNPYAWKDKLKRLLVSEEMSLRNSQEGKSLSGKFLKRYSTEQLGKIIKTLIKKKKPNFGNKKVIAFYGGIRKKTAYSMINSQWFRGFKEAKRYFIFDLNNIKHSCNKPVDYFIHHDYQQDFKEIKVPDEGKFIAVRIWDFGKFPSRWVKKINDECDQLWVYSKWAKKQAIKGGIPSGRIKVIPPGVDGKIFKPEGKKCCFSTDKKFKFIFVGGTVIRKGVDILIKAYRQAFDYKDDVCLVIKDNPKDVFYSGIKLKDKILGMANDKKGPEIIYINKYIPDKELACLYRSCNVGVFPYRAEGFAIPILEAMASGVPCMVPTFGSCLDFCSSESSFLMPVRRINSSVTRNFKLNTLGFKENVDEIDFCEVQVDVLANYLKKAFCMSKNRLQQKSRNCVKIAHGQFTWKASIKKIEKQLEKLDKYTTPIRLRKKRLENERNGRIFETAKKTFLAKSNQM